MTHFPKLGANSPRHGGRSGGQSHQDNHGAISDKEMITLYESESCRYGICDGSGMVPFWSDKDEMEKTQKCRCNNK